MRQHAFGLPSNTPTCIILKFNKEPLGFWVNPTKESGPWTMGWLGSSLVKSLRCVQLLRPHGM